MSEDQYNSEDATKLANDVFAGKLTVEEALKRLRTRLLDLSMRNRLLNYKHPKGRSVQFVGSPDLDVLYERLKEDGKSVAVSYVPDPPLETYEQGKKADARQHASLIGIDVSTELPDPTVGDVSRRSALLQSLMYPADLEKFLRKLSSEAHTVVEETGTNMLYLMFGFLEFYDSEDSDRPLLAPLVSMPVTLEKGSLDHDSRTYLYEVAYSGGDVIENFTLREKLKEFNLQLPEFDEDDSPETYFAKIQQAISRRRNWRVRRRLSVGFLSFGKLAIWADLDPAKAAGLLSNPLLRSVFEGGNTDASDALHAQDYVVDKHPAAELPLIYDADSSQHSAIIDVLEGKNLVINGPPGTGKSQTITNIIAAAMAEGKKVLFVSEKLAALEVVKHRLEKAGLGEFCLELHSNKTLKKQLLEGLAERINRRFAAPAGYVSQVEVLRERRRTLNTYAELLGSRHGNRLDLTVHEVLWAAERRRSQLGDAINVVSDISLGQAKEWTAEEFDRRRLVMMAAAAAAVDLGCPVAESPWSGFTPNLLVRGDELPVVAGLRQALDHANALGAAASALGVHVGRGFWSIAELQRLNEALDQLNLEIDVVPGLLESMYAGKSRDVLMVKDEAARMAQSLLCLRKLVEVADATLLPGPTPDGLAFERLRARAADALASASFGKTAAQLLEWSRASSEAIEGAIADQPSAVTSFTRDHARALAELQESLRDHESLGCLRKTSVEIGVAAADALETCRTVASFLQQVHAVLAPSGVKLGKRVSDVQGFLDGRGYGELLAGALISPESVDVLKALCEEGFAEWTAERLASASKDLMEDAGAAKAALEGLQKICGKVDFPFDATTAGLEAVEALLAIAEQAPVDLLSHRSKTFETPALAEAAVQAEEVHRSVQRMSTKVQDHFHIDALPDVPEIKSIVRVFRRGDGFFNFMKSDWRNAKATFAGCYKDQRKFKAKAMEERMALVLKWKLAVTDYEGSDLYRAKLGGLFQGLRTDFAKIRRLHEWYRAGARLRLQHWLLAEHLELTSVPEAHLSVLAAQAPKIRAWVKALSKAKQLPTSLPGMDPALASLKRADEIVPHLFAYAQRAAESAASLRQAVRPGTSVARARDLAELRLRVQANSASFTSLLEAPKQLASAAQRVGLEDVADPREDLQATLGAVKVASERAARISLHVAATLGPQISPLSALKFLSSVSQLGSHVGLHAAPLPASKAPQDWAALFAHYRESANAAGALAQILVEQARADATVDQAIRGVQARLQAFDALESLEEDEEFKRRFGGFIRGTSTDERALNSCLAWADAVTSLQPELPVEMADALLRQR